MHINLFPLGACLRGELSGADIAHIQSYQWGENHGLQAFEVFTSSSLLGLATEQKGGFNYEVTP